MGRALRAAWSLSRPTLASVLCGGLALGVGVMVYWTDRHHGSASLIPGAAVMTRQHFFGTLGGWLPSFVYPLAFSLFSAALLVPRPRWQYGACAFWFAVNVAFEIGQHPQIRGVLADALRHGLGQGHVARALENYFLRGTFDVGDLVAAALGAALAARILYWHRVHQEYHLAP